MEKVKLTAEQVKGLLFLKDDGMYTDDFIVNQHPRWDSKICAPLRELKISDIAKALYIGYEIEPGKPKFKAGDAVLHKRTNSLTRLDEKTADFVNTQYIDRDELRHATPEEIYWLETLGRERVGHLKVGDAYIGAYDEIFCVEHEDDFYHLETALTYGSLRGIYPAESFKPFPKDE